MSMNRTALPQRTLRERQVDMGLSLLLALQGFTLFVAIPLGGATPAGRLLLDVCHLLFAVICIGVLARRLATRVALLAALLLLVAGPALAIHAGPNLRLGDAAQHEIIALIAFVFNAGVTALVAGHVFAPGRVTVHRVRGAILLYLNVAALFAIAYGALAMYVAGAFVFPAHMSVNILDHGTTAAFSYFSLATITTTGYGDIAPFHPLARSLANLEAVIGQLFPATLLTRLVSLHMLHERDGATTSVEPS